MFFVDLEAIIELSRTSLWNLFAANQLSPSNCSRDKALLYTSIQYSKTDSPVSLAAAATKSLQSCPTLCDPIDRSPPGSPIPGILQARTLEWVAISFSSAWKGKVKRKLLSHVWLSSTPWTRLLCPWDFPGKSTGVGCHCLLPMAL